MSNRYYIPPERNDSLLGIANIGARIYLGSQENERGMAREKLMQEQNDLLRQGKEAETEKIVRMYGGTLPDPNNPGGPRLQIEGIEPRKLSLLETQGQAAVAKQETELPSSKQFDAGSIERFRGLVLTKAQRDGVDPDGLKAINDVWNEGPLKILDPYVRDPNIKKGDVFNEVMNPTTYNLLYDSAIDGYRKKYQDLILKDPSKADSPTGRALLNAVSEFEKDREKGSMIQYFFGDVIQERKFKNAEMASKLKDQSKVVGNALVNPAEIDPTTGQARVLYKGEADWDAPYLDNAGNLLQRNKSTGKVDKVTSPPQGFMFQNDGQGGFTLVQGAGVTGALAKPTVNKLQEKVVTNADTLARLDAIGQGFNPKFMELETRLGAETTRWKEKLGMDVDPESKATLSEYSAFRRDAIENLNIHIKDTTGAAMSEVEAKRIRKAMPDPGTGIFDGDSPTEFKSKWRSVMRSLKLSQARATYLLQNGVTEQALKGMAKTDTLPSFGQIENIIKNRNTQLEQELKSANPGMDQAQVDSLVAQQLKKEFGI